MVKQLKAMVDMALTPSEQEEITNPAPPRYPYGLCICLCQDELEKLGLSQEGVEIGDMLHLFCLAKVTSISTNSNETTGDSCRIELQITHISSESESEDEENRTVEKRMSKLYNK